MDRNSSELVEAPTAAPAAGEPVAAEPAASLRDVIAESKAAIAEETTSRVPKRGRGRPKGSSKRRPGARPAAASSEFQDADPGFSEPVQPAPDLAPVIGKGLQNFCDYRADVTRFEGWRMKEDEANSHGAMIDQALSQYMPAIADKHPGMVTAIMCCGSLAVALGMRHLACERFQAEEAARVSTQTQTPAYPPPGDELIRGGSLFPTVQA